MSEKTEIITDAIVEIARAAANAHGHCSDAMVRAALKAALPHTVDRLAKCFGDEVILESDSEEEVIEKEAVNMFCSAMRELAEHGHNPLDKSMGSVYPPSP